MRWLGKVGSESDRGKLGVDADVVGYLSSDIINFDPPSVIDFPIFPVRLYHSFTFFLKFLYCSYFCICFSVLVCVFIMYIQCKEIDNYRNHPRTCTHYIYLRTKNPQY